MNFGFIAALSLYLLGFAFLTYSCIVADPRKSPTARWMTETMPNFILKKLKALMGPKALRWFDQQSRYLQYFLQLVYLVVVLGSWSIMFADGYPLITESTHVSTYHTYAGYLVFALCMGSWRYACGTSPGNITERTLAKYDSYPYDGLMFTDKICPTKKIRKLARSKYDRYTGRHIPRFDHFCGWLNQPIGEENYLFFLAFLAVHVFMCYYGAIVTGRVFVGIVREKDLLNATFFNAVTGLEVKASKMIVFNYLLMRHFYLAMVFVLMSVMAFVLSFFMLFHLYITAKGMTTNEFYKWKSVKKWHKAALVKYEKALKEGKIEKNSGKLTVEPERNGMDAVDDVDIGCTGPASNADSSGDDNEDRIMNPGPLPKYIYDNGIVENFREVIYPRSMRQDALDRWAESLRQNSKPMPIEVTVEGKSKAS